MKILQPKTKRQLDFHIHPSAKPAFELASSLPLLFDKTRFEHAQLETINRGHTLHVITSKPNIAYLFSGFELISFSYSQFNPDTFIIIEHASLTEEDIEQWAWLGLLRSILSSISSSQLESLRCQLNAELNKDLLSAVFGNKKLSQARLAHLAQVTRTCLAKQAEAIKQQQSKPDIVNCPDISIFERLVQEQSNE